MLNWYINDEGTLEVYIDNKILFEISNCGGMKIEEIKKMIEYELKESGYEV